MNKPKEPEVIPPEKAIVPVASPPPSNFEKNIAKLKTLLNLIFKKEDVRNRLSAILNPEKSQTSSKLSPDQVNFVVDAYWLGKTWPELYGPLKDYADERLLTQLSEKGWGVERAIDLTGRIEGSQILKGMFGSVEPQKRKLPGFNRGETKQ